MVEIRWSTRTVDPDRMRQAVAKLAGFNTWEAARDHAIGKTTPRPVAEDEEALPCPS